MCDNIMISVKDVTREYLMGTQIVRALDGINLSVRRSEYISIMGPSGSGKSTLFNMIGGLDSPTTGEVLIDGMEIKQMNQKQLAYVRCKKIGYIFQTFNLIEALSALENVMLPLTLGGMSDEKAVIRAREMLNHVSLSGYERHRPSQLSGGQQQRIAVARALANQPSILLADEPTANLDLKTGEDLIAFLKSLNETLHITVVTATHDHKMLAASDRVIYLEDGKIVDIKSKNELSISFGEVDGQIH